MPEEADADAPRELHRAANVSKFAYSVPQTVYGSVIFMPVLVEVDTFKEWLRWHGLSYFWLVVSYGCQVMFLVGVHNVSHGLNEEMIEGQCYELIPYLLGVAFFACTVCVLTDLQETWDFLHLLRHHIPTVERTSTLKFAPSGDDGLRIAEGGFSMFRKILIVVFILIPKLLLAVALLVMSYLFLSVSPENMEVVLNATALIFIIEMDEAVYDFFSLPEVRGLMGAFPTFEEEDVKTKASVRMRPVWRLLKFLLACALVVVGLSTFKRCGNEGGRWLPLVN